jgi:GT2 family glycosyltransferase
MKKRSTKLSVIIVTYNSGLYLYKCLDSVEKFNDLEDGLEVIIVDNTSRVESESIAEQISGKYSFLRRVEYSGSNVGFGTANNIGVDLAQGSHICFLNADTLLTEPIFKRAVGRFSNPNIRTVGPKLLNQKGESELSFFFIRGYLSSFSSFLVFRLNDLNYKCNNMITSGACMFVRKKDFDSIGGFNLNMFLYHEESYLAMKFKKHFRDNIFLFDKSMSVIHLEKSEPASAFLASEYYRSMAFYYKYFDFNVNILLAVFYCKQVLRKFCSKSKAANSLSEYQIFKFSLSKDL